MNMIKKIYAFLTGGKLVWLLDQDGKITLSIARIDHFGNLRSEMHWRPWNIRSVILNPDGTVDGSYVKYWIYY